MAQLKKRGFFAGSFLVATLLVSQYGWSANQTRTYDSELRLANEVSDTDLGALVDPSTQAFMLSRLGLALSHRGAEVNILVAIPPGMAPSFTPPAGMVDGRIGNIVSIRLPLDQAASLAEHPDIIGMSLAKSFRPTLDHSIPDTGGCRHHRQWH